MLATPCGSKASWSRREIFAHSFITFMKRSAAICLLVPLLALSAFAAPANVLTVALDAPAKPISPDLFGIFFEDLNYAADGGLYAELIQNRSFEYNATEQMDWSPFTAWTKVVRDG